MTEHNGTGPTVDAAEGLSLEVSNEMFLKVIDQLATENARLRLAVAAASAEILTARAALGQLIAPPSVLTSVPDAD